MAKKNWVLLDSDKNVALHAVDIEPDDVDADSGQRDEENGQGEITEPLPLIGRRPEPEQEDREGEEADEELHPDELDVIGPLEDFEERRRVHQWCPPPWDESSS